MSRIDAELKRIKKILQKNFEGMPGRAEDEERRLKADVERGEAEVIIGGFITPEEGFSTKEKVEEDNRKKERIFLLVKTLPMPQNRSVKVIFQTMEDRENDELLHMLHKQTKA